MKTFSSVAQMKLAFLTAGQLVETSGYYTVGDGGQARYLVKVNESVDNLGNHDLAGTTVAILQVIGSANVKQFGAKGDGVTDDEANFDRAWFVSDPARVFVPVASYEIPGVVTGDFYSFGLVTIVTGSVDAISNTGADASVSVPGTSETATQAEVDTGTDPLRYVTPATLKAARTGNVKGSFTGTLTGTSVGNTSPFSYITEVLDAIYTRVTLWVEGTGLTGTSDANTLSITGLPLAITPKAATPIGLGITRVIDSSNTGPSAFSVAAAGNSIVFTYPDGDWQGGPGGTFSPTGFTITGTKGIGSGWNVQYIIEHA